MKRLLPAVLLVLLPAAARATLYSAAGGYQYVGGNAAFWGNEWWAFGNMRLEGGWYPYARASMFNDSSYSWAFAPTTGLEKGFEGLGKGRVGYTYYRGDRRDGAGADQSHTAELGWSRAFSLRFSGDVAYRLITGEIFPANVNVNGSEAQGTVPVSNMVIHQGQLSLGWNVPVSRRYLRFDTAFSLSSSVNGANPTSETFALACPIVGGLAFQTALTLAQHSGPGRYYLGAGLFYSISGVLGASSRNR